eukprot:COSAG01_NODE_564_length_15447_cov_14.174811_6_plen_102_part_00
MTMVLEHVAGQGGEGTPGRGARNMLTVCYDGLRTDLTTQHTYVYRTLCEGHASHMPTAFWSYTGRLISTSGAHRELLRLFKHARYSVLTIQLLCLHMFGTS